MKILISSCLLGQKVRYDGGHCFAMNPWLESLHGKGYLVHVCPEVEAGLGVPRSPIELRDGQIITERGESLNHMFMPVLKGLEETIREQNICMAILKEKSPSCGVNKVYDGGFSGKVVKGQGLVAAFLSERMPVYSEHELSQAQKTYEALVCPGN